MDETAAMQSWLKITILLLSTLFPMVGTQLSTEQISILFLFTLGITALVAR